MLIKEARYAFISITSFCFFTVVFQAAAYAQTVAPSEDHPPHTLKYHKPQILPTPTIYMVPTTTLLTAVQSQPSATRLPEFDQAPPATQILALSEPTLTPTPTPTVTPTIIPTATPIPPTPTAIPTQVPAQVISTGTSPANPVQGGLNAEKLFSMTNSYRQSQGLPAFQKDDRTCSLAASRAPEINGEIAAGIMHSGLRARGLPYWNTENIISMNSEDAAFNWWINDPIHHDAIVGNYTYSCVACSGNACAQEFTNYQPK